MESKEPIWKGKLKPCCCDGLWNTTCRCGECSVCKDLTSQLNNELLRKITQAGTVDKMLQASLVGMSQSNTNQ